MSWCTRELFKYDPEGSLHRHCDRDGTVKIFEYDYLGRVLHIERYGRSTKSSGKYLGSLYCTDNSLHKLTEKDEAGLETTYMYDNAGRLSSMSTETNSLTFPMGSSIINHSDLIPNWDWKCSLVAGGYGAVKGVIAFNRLARMPIKASRALSKGIYRSKSAYQGNLLKTHLRQIEEYGEGGYRQLSNGRIRYYGEMDPARVKGEMAGRRLVREWSPESGFKRTWHETLDYDGNVRSLDQKKMI